MSVDTATTYNHWTKTTMDGLGRTIKVEKGDTDSTKSIVETEYQPCGCSPLGKVKRVSQPYAPGGTVYWTTYNYDALGRTTSVQSADGASTTTYVLEGNTTKVTDPAGKWKKYTKDVFGNLTQVTEPNPGGGANLETYYTYDLLDHLTQVSMTRVSTTQTRTFNYDATTQRLMSEIHPETGTTTYEYNTDGTLKKRTDAAGKIVNYTYDSYQRLTSGLGATLTYDMAPGDTDYSRNAWGRVAMAQYSAGGNIFNDYYKYDSPGQVIEKKMTMNTSASLTTNYSYNTEGQLIGVSYPDDYVPDPDNPGHHLYNYGPEYDYILDAMGRPYKMTERTYKSGSGWTTIDYVKDVAYGPAGELTQMTYFSQYYGTSPRYYTESKTYNIRLQLTRLVTTVQDFMGVPVDMEYVYSPTANNGQITQARDNRNAEEINYTYDSLGQLTAAVTTGPQWGLSFTYQLFGNRTAQTVTKGSGPSSSLSYDPPTNRITSSGYSYLANGNLSTMPRAPSGTTTLEYDNLNRLTKSTSAVVEEYAYGPQNERVWKKNGSVEEFYLYGAFGELLGKYRVDVEPFSPYWNRFVCLGRNVYFQGKLIRSQDGAVITDRLGSVRSRYSDTTGGEASRFYPFGEENSVYSLNNREKFATYFRDNQTLLDYARNRYYSSTQGRFTTPDPFRGSANLANPLSWNRFAYVANDPINRNDPEGLGPEFPERGGKNWWWVCYWSGMCGNPQGRVGPVLNPGGGTVANAIQNAVKAASLLVKNKDRAEFLKATLKGLGLEADLGHFLTVFNKSDFKMTPDPANDSFIKENGDRYTAHVDVVGDSNIIHIDDLGASNISVTLLHEEFHTINYGFDDVRLAKTVKSDWTPPRDAVRIKDKVKAASDFFSNAMEAKCGGR